MTVRPATMATTESPRNTESGLSFSAGNTMLMHVVMTAPPRQDASAAALDRSRSGWIAVVSARAGTANTVSRISCARIRRRYTFQAGTWVPGRSRSGWVAVNW
jgi:hypothetical protein